MSSESMNGCVSATLRNNSRKRKLEASGNKGSEKKREGNSQDIGGKKS